MTADTANWNFTDRVVLVTGAEDDRGRNQVAAFLAAGAKVIACGPDKAQLEGLQALAGPGEIEIVEADLTSEPQVEALAGRLGSFDRLDAMILNDGPRPDSPLVDVTVEEWEALVAGSLTSAFLCAKHLAPLMFPRSYGKIVFTTGPESRAGVSGRAHICATRHALVGLAKDLAIEVAGHKVNVNVAAAAGEVDREGGQDAIDALTHVVMWLSSDASRFVTGSVVTADHEASLQVAV